LMNEVDGLLERSLGCANLTPEGFMTIAPYAPDNPSVAQRAFTRLRELRDRLKDDFKLDLPELSMGMSGDMREAIEAGSTMVRVGSALFGARKE
jgi:PLP dependent protein